MTHDVTDAEDEFLLIHVFKSLRKHKIFFVCSVSKTNECKFHFKNIFVEIGWLICDPTIIKKLPNMYQCRH